MRIKLYKKNNDPKELAKIVQVLKDGGLIIYPTDTLYAIGCDALNVRAVEKICAFKKIDPKKNNLSIICPDLSNISQYAKVDDVVFKLMKRNLPGAFTFILPTGGNLPKIYKNRKEVGLRIPDHDLIREITHLLGNPILTTSLPIVEDEMEYSTDPELMYEKYQTMVDLVIDGGIGTIEQSTIVNCTHENIEIVRQGKGELIV